MRERQETPSAITGNSATTSPNTAFVLRTRIYRGVWTPALDAALTRCQHAQRAVYNRTVDAVVPEGGPIPAKLKRPSEPDALYGQLTEWRAAHPWMAAMPVALARPAVSQARTALTAHEDAVRTRCERLLEEEAVWAQWMAGHPDWDPGAWDALAAAEKRKAIKAGEAPPQSASTWRDERAGDGARGSLHIRRKRSMHRAVHWDTPPTRVDDSTLSLAGLGGIEVVANNPLPQAQRLRAVRVCVRRGARGRRRIEVHLSVRVDVVPRTKRPRKTPLVAGADMGCAHTVTLHNAKTLSLPDHGSTLERALATQGRMNACVKGSRKWRDERETMRTAHATMRARDRDAIRKFAAWLARHFDVVGFESLQIKTMTESAKTRGVADVEQVQRLNRSIRKACWRMTQDAAGAALEARGGQALKLPAMDSSETCAQCGHIDAASRKAKRFRCTGCAHENDADVNAARIMRGRALRWLKLRANADTDGEAHKALWDELKAKRGAHSKNTGGAGATTKPACAHSGHDHGGAGAPSTALAGTGTPRNSPETDCPEGGVLRGHEERSIGDLHPKEWSSDQHGESAADR